MKRLAVVVLASCGLDALDPQEPPPPLPTPAPRKGLNELAPTSMLLGPAGAIATNGIPNLVTAPVTLGGASLPPRALPFGKRIAGIPAPFSLAAIAKLVVPDELVAVLELGSLSLAGGTGVAATVELGGVPLDITVAGAIVNDAPIDVDLTGIAISRCKVSGLDVANAAVLDLDLGGEDLNEVVLQGISLAGRADVASGTWVTGLSAGSIKCDCAVGLPQSDVELTECLPIEAPYEVSVLVRATPPADVVLPVSRLHLALDDQLPDGTPTPLCRSGLPTTEPACTLASGTFVDGACTLPDSDYDLAGLPGYTADGIAVSTLDGYLRASAMAAFKVAFHRNVTATLTCNEPARPNPSFDFTGDIGTAGLFGGSRWLDAADPRVLDQQRWFSATYMALVNPFEQRVHISMRHPDGGPTTFGSGRPWPLATRPFPDTLDLDDDGVAELDLKTEYGEKEGIYYGNLFTGPCATLDAHPDCKSKQDPGDAYVDFIRIRDAVSEMVDIGIMNTDVDEAGCRALFEADGKSFDPAIHYPTLGINEQAHMCIEQPRVCALLPPIASYFCPFDIHGGFTFNFCRDAADPRLGSTDCDGADATDLWTQQLTVFLHTDPARRRFVDAETTCRSVNKLRIAVHGCYDPAIADCNGDGVPDGCFDATR